MVKTQVRALKVEGFYFFFQLVDFNKKSFILHFDMFKTFPSIILQRFFLILNSDRRIPVGYQLS